LSRRDNQNAARLLRDNYNATIMPACDAGVLILIVAVFPSRSPRYKPFSRFSTVQSVSA